ncbi:MAG: methionine--tRNA ligase [Saprospiraceae bacterium]|nr:methionine--tRNA ligase [Saprospiraceae bacterium]
MLKLPKRFLITAALPYANGPLHIGHLAGAYLPADIYVRFLRLNGKEVLFVCGSDEHGAAITMKAAKEGKTPQEIIDKYHASFEDTFRKLGISFDIYHRTSSAIHHETSQEFFKTLWQKGEFIQKQSEQYYDEKFGQFLADRYIIGTCPKCQNEEAYGDQCERCGSSLSPLDLINPRSTLSGEKPILKSTTHWYLPLEKHEAWLREWINQGIINGVEQHEPEFWKDHVTGQCNSWLDSGLQPRAMTRDLDWGVDVPKEIPGHEGKKLYVWLDAPIGYISATKQWAKDNGKDWKKYWQDEDTGLLHFIGKDNIVFHCLIFPSILKAHGGYILPKNVPANQFMNLEGRKISTSKGWAVWAHEYLEDFPEMQDALRYVMIKNMPEQKDSEFTWKGFQELVNNELVNNLANFVQRVMVLINKYYKGKIPKFDEDTEIEAADQSGLPTFVDAELMELFDKVYEMNTCIWEYNFRGGLKWLMDISSWGNQILQANEPWKIEKEDPAKVKACMALCGQIVAALSVAMRPFLPFTSDKLRTMLNMPAFKDHRELVDMQNKLADGRLILKSGHQIGEPVHLFSRIPDEMIDIQIRKLATASAQSQATSKNHKPVKETIQFEDFSKMDIRTGTILEAAKVPNADKLLQLKVDIGFEERTIVSGISQHFNPEELIGRQVMVLVNLAPRKIKGIESNGMILMAENHEGALGMMSPPEGWANGSCIS